MVLGLFRSAAPLARVRWPSTAIGQIAYSLIPPVLGAVNDLSGGYGVVLGVYIVLQLAAALLIRGRAAKANLMRRGGTQADDGATVRA